MNIEQVDNGYIVSGIGLTHHQKVFHTLEEVFTEMLAHFEGRFEGLGGNSYGEVRIYRDDQHKPEALEVKS